MTFLQKPLLSQRSKSRSAGAGNEQSSFMTTNCPECNDMGIGDDDFHHFEGDLHAEVDETEEGEGRLRTSRIRSSRGGRSHRCSVHDAHFTLLSNPAANAADLEAGNGHPAHRHASSNHVGAGSRKDLHMAGEHNGDKKIAQPKQRSCFGGRIRIPSKRAKKIDFFSRVIFPMVFFTFNLIYWNSYL